MTLFDDDGFLQGTGCWERRRGRYGEKLVIVVITMCYYNVVFEFFLFCRVAVVDGEVGCLRLTFQVSLSTDAGG